MQPHLVKWATDFAASGLVIVDIDNGRIDTKAKVESHFTDDKIPYRTIWDEDATITTAYGIRGFPTAYLLDAQGQVIWEGFPLPEVDSLTTLIETELEKLAQDKRSDPDGAVDAVLPTEGEGDSSEAPPGPGK